MKKKQHHNNVRWLILLFIIFFIGLFISLNVSHNREVRFPNSITRGNVNSVLANVLFVIDGDTIDVSIGGKKERVRLLGIDAPEMGFENKKEMCFAKESRNKLVELIDGKTVSIASDSTQQNRDAYNRILRYMYLPDGTFVNTQMAEEGYAYEYTYKELPYLYQKEFQEAQQKAKSLKLGLWADGACQ